MTFTYLSPIEKDNMHCFACAQLLYISLRPMLEKVFLDCAQGHHLDFPTQEPRALWSQCGVQFWPWETLLHSELHPVVLGKALSLFSPYLSHRCHTKIAALNSLEDRWDPNMV